MIWNIQGKPTRDYSARYLSLKPENTCYTLNKATFILKQNIYTVSNYLSKTGTTKYHSYNTSNSPKILLLPDSWSLEKTKAHRFTEIKRFLNYQCSLSPWETPLLSATNTRLLLVAIHFKKPLLKSDSYCLFRYFYFIINSKIGLFLSLFSIHKNLQSTIHYLMHKRLMYLTLKKKLCQAWAKTQRRI